MKYNVNGVRINLVEDEVLVSGSVKIFSVSFTFDESWDEYTTKLAVFKCKSCEKEQIIVNGECEIPWESLRACGPLQIGVYGKTAEKVRPTIWAAEKMVFPGTEPGETPAEPSPDKWQQLLKLFEDIATGVSPHIGENGNWYLGDEDTGVQAQGEPGSPYVLTETDKAEMVQAVLDALPNGDEVSY